MDKNKANVPKIRFPGFTDPWEQRKLGDESIEIVAGGDINKNKIVDSGKYPVLANALTNDGIVGYYEDNFRIKAPAVTVTGRGDVGHAKARKVDFTPVVRLLSVKTKHDVDFLENAINNHEVLVESTGVPQLTVPQLSKYEIYFPKTDNEEKVIGAFFQNLDDLITIHQRKLNHLQDKKKSLLQKMFPKNGEDFPELRFPGFTDPWKQRKFCDEVKTRRGLTYKPSDIQEKGIRVLRSSNIDGDQFVLKEDDIFVSLKAINIDYIKENDILITSANGSSKLVGKHALVSKIGKKSAVHGGFMLLGTANEPFFVNASMSSEWYKRFIDLYVSGGNGAIGNLNKSDLDKQEVMFPSRAEQAQIGVFFKNIDNLITLHQRKLKHLQEQKKALLQQMFV